jgi:hypothetical protein
MLVHSCVLLFECNYIFSQLLLSLFVIHGLCFTNNCLNLRVQAGIIHVIPKLISFFS